MKTTSLLLFYVLVFLLCACHPQSTQPVNPAIQENAATEQEDVDSVSLQPGKTVAQTGQLAHEKSPGHEKGVNEGKDAINNAVKDTRKDNSMKDNENSQASQLTQIYRSTICDSITSSMWISSRDQYENMTGAAPRQLLPADGSSMPDVDFSSYGVALISMGQQRTGGYSIKLADTQLQQDNSVALIKVSWNEPAKGMIVTQALTNPCVHVQVPLAALAAVKQLKIVDQQGIERATLTVE